jgi:hypothetical protein
MSSASPDARFALGVHSLGQARNAAQSTSYRSSGLRHEKKIGESMK